MQQGAGRLVEHQPGQPGGGQPVDDPALSWLAHCGGDAAEGGRKAQVEGKKKATDTELCILLQQQLSSQCTY